MTDALSPTEAETVLVGALLRHNDLLEDCEGLEGRHFSDATIGELYGVIAERVGAGHVATPATLQAWAAGKGIEFHVLENLHARGLRLSSDLHALADEIRRAHQKRAVLGALEASISHISQNPDAEPFEMLGFAETLLRSADLGASGDDVTADVLSERFYERFSAGVSRGITTGYRALNDRHGSFERGEVIIVAGQTGMGKTTIATNLARRWASAGLRGHYASYEMKDSQIVPRFWSALSHSERHIQPFEYTMLRHRTSNVPTETIERCRESMREKYGNLNVGIGPAQTPAELEASLRAARRKLGGLDFCIVDYLQLMRSSSVGAPRTEQVTEISRALKALAMRLDVVMVSLCQINRENEKRTDKRPQVTDMRESGAIEQDADVILGAYRRARYLEIKDTTEMDDATLWAHEKDIEKWRNSLEIITLKARQGPTGIDHFQCFMGFDTIEDADKTSQPEQRGETPRAPRWVQD